MLTLLFSVCPKSYVVNDLLLRCSIKRIHAPAGFAGSPDDVNGEGNVTDLRYPHLWYPEARALDRKIICHVGPTNSGKTFQALQQLQESSRGVYCGPLRLLAWEVSEQLNGAGLPCNLITGQEIIRQHKAFHSSCTVEMADTRLLYDCAVIDEVQLIGCSQRGWAWTRALLGLRAKELHLCGSPSFLPLVHEIASVTGENVEVLEYDRLGPLEIATKPIKSLSRVQPGDCVVAFSRKKLYELKQDIETRSQGRVRCCLVYGALPPEARREQARIFNDPEESSYQVLVASDAVGMGLNLSIRRLVFHTLEKFDGIKQRLLSPSEIKQIAGRAGRFQSQYPEGIVTTLEKKDLRMLKAAIAVPDSHIQSAGLFPTFEQLQRFAEVAGFSLEVDNHLKGKDKRKRKRKKARLKNVKFSYLLQRFADVARTDEKGTYFMCDVSEMKAIADCIQPIPLSFQHRYTFTMAPVDVKNIEILLWLKWYASKFCYDREVPLGFSLVRRQPAKTSLQLKKLEDLHAVLDLYLWLGIRLKNEFQEYEKAKLEQKICNELIEDSILEMKPFKKRAPSTQSPKQHRNFRI